MSTYQTNKYIKTITINFNPSKTKTMIYTRRRIDDQQISEVSSRKHLGIYLSKDLSFHKQINFIKQKAWTQLNIMKKLKFQLDRSS